MQRDRLSRREFLARLGIGTLSIGAVGALANCKGGEGGGTAACNDLTGVPDAAKATRTALKYVDTSVTEGKSCEKCQQFTAPAGGAACGTCKLFAGPVSPKGYCTGFVVKAG